MTGASSRVDRPLQREASTDAFEFVRELASELTTGEIELPSFPEVAAQVQKVLSQDDSGSARNRCWRRGCCRWPTPRHSTREAGQSPTCALRSRVWVSTRCDPPPSVL